MAITTIEEIQEYLNSKDIPAAHIEKLTGGTGNFIWRITTLLGRTSIIKHAAPFIATYQDKPFDVERMTFEVKALQTIPSIIPEDPTIKIPRLLFHDDEAHVIGIQDVGDKTLRDLYQDPRFDVAQVGQKLGTWLARLHSITSKGDLKYSFDNKTAKKMYPWNYENLHASLEKHGFDPKLGERIHGKYGLKMQTDDVCICHGDLWPNNILFDEEELGTGADLKFNIIDWELARLGNGITDIGQFSAESFFLDSFRGGRGLLRVFLGAYVSERPLSRSDQERFAAHFGTHIGFWPTIHRWMNDEQAKKAITYGNEILQRVEAQDWEWFKNNKDLGVIFEGK